MSLVPLAAEGDTTLNRDLPPGTRVRIITDPSRVGVLTGRHRARGEAFYLQVQFPEVAQYVPEHSLEVATTGDKDPFDLLAAGRVSRPRDLRRTLTHARLTGRLANVIYSLDTTGTDFYAYQFKPLVKLLNSATTGFLIADEVGLGKTIEAGLIWTELRSRFDFNRILVLCPAMLQEKWSRELRQRFGVEAEVVNAAILFERLQRTINDPNDSRFALIASLQGARPNRGWNDEANRKTDAGGASSRLARLFDRQEYELPLLDLLVIDEAHYLRNPETMTAALGRLARGASEYVILLTATPVHLKSQDLYQLVNLADPATFSRPQAFDAILEANAPLVRARELVLSGTADQAEILEALDEAARHPLLRGSRQIELIRTQVTEGGELGDPATASELAWKLESANLLGHVVTRTRKRDVHDWRVVRQPVAEAVPLSPIEEQFYQAVTEVVREYCVRSDAHEGFLLVMPQRQMASSMAAAFKSWDERSPASAEMIYEDYGDDETEVDRATIGPVVRELVTRVGRFCDFETLKENDSKYERLRNRLKDLFSEHSDARVVLFSYFKPTLAYLRKRLKADGIDSYVLHGGIENKHSVIEEFRTSSGAAVLLSSEVASEGIDLQFAWVIINYDLPWNPMRVEQRIGRLDRLGQTSPKVLIWNLFYEGTIEYRIYRRLYERLKIFEHSLGALEPFLGDAMQKLTVDLFRNRLTPDQEEARIEQTRQALQNRQSEEERLEGEAAHLVAYGDYIVNQVHAAREMSRRIDGLDLKNYVIGYLTDSYPGCEFRQLTQDLDFEMSLSADAKYDLERFLRSKRLQGLTRLDRVDARRIRCRFENSVAGAHRPGVEIINQLHPLVRFVSHQFHESDDFCMRPAVAVKLETDALKGAARDEVYVFSIQRWSMKGIRDIEHLYYAAAGLGEPHRQLDPRASELLINAASNEGFDWLEAASQVDWEAAYRVAFEHCLPHSDLAYNRKVTELEAQNQDRADLQERTLERHYASQKERLDQVLAGHERMGRKGLQEATKGKIRALTERVDRKRREIDERKQFEHSKEEICVGVIEISGGEM